MFKIITPTDMNLGILILGLIVLVLLLDVLFTDSLNV